MKGPEPQVFAAFALNDMGRQCDLYLPRHDAIIFPAPR